MSVDLDRQLHDYCQEMDSRQGVLSLEDILDRAEGAQVIPRAGDRLPSPRRRWIAVAAAALVLIVIFLGTRIFPATNESPEPVDQPTTTSTTPVPEAGTLPALGLPGTVANERAGGEYGWTGPSASAWLHNVVQGPGAGTYRQTQLFFAVSAACFAGESEAEPTPVAVAGLEGLYLEPYNGVHGRWLTSNPSGGETVGAYALPIADRTLCVYLRWDAATTADELKATRDIVESIRGVPYLENGIRINFTLPAGWDTG